MTDRISGGGSGSGGGNRGDRISVAPDAIDRDSVHIDDLADEVSRLETWHNDGCDALGKCWGEGDEVAKSFEENYLPMKAQLDSYFSALTAAFTKVARETREMSANFRRDDDAAQDDGRALTARMEAALAPQQPATAAYRLEPMQQAQTKRMLLPYRQEEETTADNVPQEWAARRTEAEPVTDRGREPQQLQPMQAARISYAGDATRDLTPLEGTVPAEPAHLLVPREPGEQAETAQRVPAEPVDAGVEPAREGVVSEPLRAAESTHVTARVPAEEAGHTHWSPALEPVDPGVPAQNAGYALQPAEPWQAARTPAEPADFGVEPGRDGVVSEPLRPMEPVMPRESVPMEPFTEPVDAGVEPAWEGAVSEPMRNEMGEVLPSVLPAEPAEYGVAPLSDTEGRAPGDGRV
ncbi:hypothetical protein [Nocardiopsis coralliicola]